MVDREKLAEPGSLEDTLLRQIDLERLPRHIAVIMDGNGRWAQARGLPRVEGHRNGVQAVTDVVGAASKLGLDVLTLYAFSTENWKRPRYEVWTLMNLLKDYVYRELDRLVENNIRVRVIGRWKELDASVVKALQWGLDGTRECTGMELNLALNYSGRTEIVDACRQIVADWAAGTGADIDAETIGNYLSTAGQPDPDLLIRSSGEMRLSNFLLWQLAYTEIWVTDTLWPDFRRQHLLQAILGFQRRDRRFGGLVEDGVESARESGGG